MEYVEFHPMLSLPFLVDAISNVAPLALRTLALCTRSSKVRALSKSLKIPTGPAARIVEPGSVEWLELQRGAAYTPSSGSSYAAGGAAAAALAGVMTGGAGQTAQRSTSVEEATVGVETTTAKDSTNLAAKER